MKVYPITGLTKEDIIIALKDYDDCKGLSQRVASLTDDDMKMIASKMADDYCNQLFWDSLRSIMEDKFL